MDFAFRYCEDLVRDEDKDRYVAALFASAQSRPALLALYAFDLEVRRIPDRVREPLAGEVRLQWWREALEGKRDAEAQANPVAAALLAGLRRHGVAVDTPLRVLEARGLDCYADRFPDSAAIAMYAEQTAGAILRCAARILGGGDLPRAIEEDAALALTLMDVLRTLGHDAAHGRVRLPEDLMQRHGVSRGDVLARNDTAGLRAALAEIRGQAERRASSALGAVHAIPAEARPAFLTLAPVPIYLRALGRGNDPFAPNKVPSWRRQWAIWRAARRGSR